MSRRHAPNPPVAKELAKLTLAEIEAGRTPRGAWTRETLHGWGIPWPPATGWIEKLTGGQKPLGKAVTLLCDASYCPETRAAGYAGWLKADGAPGVFVGAQLPDGLAGSTIAELMAVQATLDAGIARGIVEIGDVVMLQSDSVPALAAILMACPTAGHSQGPQDSLPVVTARRLERSIRHSGIHLEVAKTISDLGLRVTVRHVSAHIGRKTGRTSIHAQADVMAKTFMRQRRAELRTVA